MARGFWPSASGLARAGSTRGGMTGPVWAPAKGGRADREKLAAAARDRISLFIGGLASLDLGAPSQLASLLGHFLAGLLEGVEFGHGQQIVDHLGQMGVDRL